MVWMGPVRLRRCRDNECIISSVEIEQPGRMDPYKVENLCRGREKQPEANTQIDLLFRSISCSDAFIQRLV